MPTPIANTLPPGAPQPGDVLGGKYRVERVLGLGGMGMVVAAMHIELDERVAVKLLLPQAAANATDAVARFVREAKAAIKIKSDHVVRVIDTGRLEGGAPFIVMEYLEGCDLHALLEREGRLPIDVAVDYLLQACDAIAAAHAMGIVHRDLKPGNLFLTKKTDGSPLVKVLDFGISKVLHAPGIDGAVSSGVTTTTTIMGTPAFMSPEQLRSTRAVDARADLWSMGTILFALLTGAPPYDGESTADIAAKIIRDPPPPIRAQRPEIPEELEAVIVRCLAKEPDGRYPGVAELADALLPFASERSRSAAQRIAKQISSRQLGNAPTLRSTATPETTPATSLASASPATRTASAFGTTKPSEEDGKRATGSKRGIAIAAITGAVIVGAVVAFAVPRGAPAAASAAAAASATATATASASASASASAAAAAAAAASASASAASPAIASPIASARPHRPPARKPLPSSSATPPPAASGGLFDDRE